MLKTVRLSNGMTLKSSWYTHPFRTAAGKLRKQRFPVNDTIRRAEAMLADGMQWRDVLDGLGITTHAEQIEPTQQLTWRPTLWLKRVRRVWER